MKFKAEVLRDNVPIGTLNLISGEMCIRDRKMLKDELLDLVKNRLDVTFSDERTDSKIGKIISNGVAELNRLNGRENDFLVEGQAQSLLLAYVMYDLANSQDEFKKNYHSDIVSFINRGKAKNYVESKNAESV